MDLWVTEYQTPALGLSCKIRESLRVEQTEFQHLAVVDTEQFGLMLLLDGMVMTTIQDEFVYHEMITLVALNSHPAPRRVLIIGGGDGGTLREAVAHPLVEKAVMVEIDGRVVQAARDFMPALAGGFDHPKSELIIDDGISYIKERRDEFDLILVDSTEPVGPAVALFSSEFYRDCHRALKDDGMLVVQSESPFLNAPVIQMCFGGISQVFPITKLYLANVPAYPSGLWSFTVGSKRHDPEKPIHGDGLRHRYYTKDLHAAAFKLTAFVQDIVKGL